MKRVALGVASSVVVCGVAAAVALGSSAGVNVGEPTPTTLPTTTTSPGARTVTDQLVWTLAGSSNTGKRLRVQVVHGFCDGNPVAEATETKKAIKVEATTTYVSEPDRACVAMAKVDVITVKLKSAANGRKITGPKKLPTRLLSPVTSCDESNACTTIIPHLKGLRASDARSITCAYGHATTVKRRVNGELKTTSPRIKGYYVKKQSLQGKRTVKEGVSTQKASGCGDALVVSSPKQILELARTK